MCMWVASNLFSFNLTLLILVFVYDEVYIFDLRDHGESTWTNDFSFMSMISDVEHFFKKNQIERSILIGHSLGYFFLV